ncbi:MAG: transglutaminase domain-containing protein [Candidatus Omnitrophica bacterium]|nr:transglutaminase domain-containing protein [Candidatus Omnitrophota bacterium]
MRNAARKIIIVGVIALSFIVILNIDVTTKQSVNYVISIKHLPLYLKILDFYDRHYHYLLLVREIVAGEKDDEKKVMKIMEWTLKNLAKQPSELPVIDDHVWHIIVRGYGVDEQFQDVFCTLCNYAGVNAFFDKVRGDGRVRVLSFVRLGNEWRIFDAAEGIYFLNKSGKMATIENIEKMDWHPVSIGGALSNGLYQDLFNNLKYIDFQKWNNKRSSIQAPWARFSYFLTKPHL